MEWKFLVPNGEMPEKRSHHSCEVAGNRLLVFGGLSQEGKRLNDMHSLDLGTFCLNSAFIKRLSSKVNRFSTIFDLYFKSVQLRSKWQH